MHSYNLSTYNSKVKLQTSTVVLYIKNKVKVKLRTLFMKPMKD